MSRLIHIPLAFYFDHQGRDLDTPELLSDARFYADPYGPAGPPGIKTAARALVRAIERGQS